MKLEIEISEEDAACIWADNRQEQPLRVLAERILRTAANDFRRAFPKAVKKAVEDLRAAQQPVDSDQTKS